SPIATRGRGRTIAIVLGSGPAVNFFDSPSILIALLDGVRATCENRRTFAGNIEYRTIGCQLELRGASERSALMLDDVTFSSCFAIRAARHTQTRDWVLSRASAGAVLRPTGSQ